MEKLRNTDKLFRLTGMFTVFVSDHIRRFLQLRRLAAQAVVQLRNFPFQIVVSICIGFCTGYHHNPAVYFIHVVYDLIHLVKNR